MSAQPCADSARSLAVMHCRALMREHGLTVRDLFPGLTDAGTVDLDGMKASGLNSEAESQRLLAAHANRLFGRGGVDG